MLDIVDKKTGRVVAVLLDDGTVIKKEGSSDDIDKLVQEKLREMNKGKK
jgi:hypothetical protein